jgi:hypothetical protein
MNSKELHVNLMFNIRVLSSLYLSIQFSEDPYFHGTSQSEQVNICLVLVLLVVYNFFCQTN